MFRPLPIVLAIIAAVLLAGVMVVHASTAQSEINGSYSNAGG